MDFGCATHCKFAEQCLGDLPPELLTQRDDLLKDRVGVEVKRYFGRDFKRIGHATRVAGYAEKIAREEKGDLAVVLSAAYLHDIGVREVEAKCQSTERQPQYQEGVPLAREILERLGANQALIEEVCDIISHHDHPGPNETVNFKAVYDADLIVNLEEAPSPLRREKLRALIENSFMTQSGRDLARHVLLHDKEEKEAATGPLEGAGAG
jgi:HD superfamily phosphohydrolase YqeK